MDLLLQFLTSPGMVVGCLFGVAVAFAIHWLLPTADLAAVYALLIVGFGVVGLVLQEGGLFKRGRDK